ncbi:MAG: alpha/beta hydrolase family protein [Anaerolineae bacterium]|nr:alpha/beta hydrolase family protein [Anaerolineae bacterium]
MMMTTLTTQHPITPSIDLRDMLRQHLIQRSADCMEEAAQRRQNALSSGDINTYQAAVRTAVRGFYGDMPVGPNAPPVQAHTVSTFDKDGYRLENVLFDSFPGWQVNATVYVPLNFEPPYPAVVIPVGHAGKQYESYQLPAQFFARSGYMAVLFDPPGQASEKQLGNDHFRDGVRCYLVGETSSRYFVGDALRCIDYLASRPDVDMSHGVAMTGVSGGGTTTTFSALLDDRITVSGPSCCLSPRVALDIVQCYAGCPETNMWRRYAEGIDEIDLLCAAAPIPTLLMAGRTDEVFHIEDTTQLAEQVAAFYAAADAPDHFHFFVDESGHAYTLAQARQFTAFMNHWLLGTPQRSICDLPDSAFTLDPYEEMRCYPDEAVNMFSLTRQRGHELAQTRDSSPEAILAAARRSSGATNFPPAPEAATGEPFQVWTHDWEQVLLKPEPGIELPATFLATENAAATILHFDDAGRHRLLERQGPLLTAANFLQRDSDGRANILSVDLRGWGDSAPSLYPYELAGWGGIDRVTAYMSAALGDAVLSQRIRDGLSALAYLRTRVDPQSIIVTGSGLGGVVALHVAAFVDDLQAVMTWDGLVSFQALLDTPAYHWPADAFLPLALLNYDLPALAATLPCPVFIANPLDGEANPLTTADTDELNQRIGREVYRAEANYVELLRELIRA